MANDNFIRFMKLPAAITAQINHSRQSKHIYVFMESLTHTSMFYKKKEAGGFHHQT